MKIKKKNEIIGKITIIDKETAWIDFPRFPYRINIPIRERYEIQGTNIEVEKGNWIKLTVLKEYISKHNVGKVSK